MTTRPINRQRWHGLHDIMSPQLNSVKKTQPKQHNGLENEKVYDLRHKNITLTAQMVHEN